MSFRKTTAEFIAESKQKYKDKYSYGKSVYLKNNSKLILTCNIHNIDFEQTPANHLYFEGCPKCFSESQRQIFLKSSNTFISEAKSLHKGFYSYEKTQYNSIKEKVTITCPKHGDFQQFPTNHLKGCGCPKCAIFKLPGGYFDGFFNKYPEKKVIPALLYHVELIHPKFGSFYKLGITSKTLKQRFSGPQFNNIKIKEIWTLSLPLYQAWLYEQLISKILKEFRYESEFQFNGKTECFSIIIPKPSCLPDIFPHEEEKTEILKSRINIKNQINPKIIQKIFARKCEIKSVSKQEEKDFLKETHIQGYTSSCIAFGLYFQEELVELMTFGKPRFSKDYQWELIRLSSKLDTIVVGGASRLFKHFVSTINPQNIISYSDNKWNNGAIYNTIGMTFSHVSSPNYWYIKGDIILSRIQCQKHNLHNIVDNFDPLLSEKQNMLSNGFSQIKDQGNNVFVWIDK